MIAAVINSIFFISIKIKAYANITVYGYYARPFTAEFAVVGTKGNFDKEFGDFIKKKRRELGLTQPELASIVGNNFQNISRLERGLISPTLFWLHNLATGLRIPLSEFIKEFEEYRKLKRKN